MIKTKCIMFFFKQFYIHGFFFVCVQVQLKMIDHSKDDADIDNIDNNKNSKYNDKLL